MCSRTRCRDPGADAPPPCRPRNPVGMSRRRMPPRRLVVRRRCPAPRASPPRRTIASSTSILPNAARARSPSAAAWDAPVGRPGSAPAPAVVRRRLRHVDRRRVDQPAPARGGHRPAATRRRRSLPTRSAAPRASVGVDPPLLGPVLGPGHRVSPRAIDPRRYDGSPPARDPPVRDIGGQIRARTRTHHHRHPFSDDVQRIDPQLGARRAIGDPLSRVHHRSTLPTERITTTAASSRTGAART